MTRPSDLRLAQISIGLLLLVIVRCLGEFFRLYYVYADALAIGQVTPYVAGALFAAVALALAVIGYFTGRYRVSIAIAAATIALLFVYKVAVVG